MNVIPSSFNEVDVLIILSHRNKGGRKRFFGFMFMTKVFIGLMKSLLSEAHDTRLFISNCESFDNEVGT